MKNYLLTLIAMCALSFLTYAQDAGQGTVEINKISQPCVKATYSISADMVEGALKKKFSDAKLGSSSKATDGFRVYKGVVVPEIAKEKIDVYYKVEDKKPSSTIYMLTSKGYDNFMKPETDAEAVQNTINFLNLFVKDATAFLLNDQIDKQNDIISDIEKNAKNASKDAASLAKDKTKLESKISDNAIEAGTLKNEMENEQKALELVKTKTATIDQVDALKKEVSKQETKTRKANKHYDNAVSDGAGYKEDLAKKIKDIDDNQTEQATIKNDLEAAKRKLEDLKSQLNGIK